MDAIGLNQMFLSRFIPHRFTSKFGEMGLILRLLLFCLAQETGDTPKTTAIFQFANVELATNFGFPRVMLQVR